MTGEAAQQQIDTRAIEIASSAHSRIEAHEERCNAREEQAAASRAELKQDMRNGFDRLDRAVTEQGQALQERLSKEKDARYRRDLGVAGAAILLLLSGFVFLFVKLIGWG